MLLPMKWARALKAEYKKREVTFLLPLVFLYVV